MTNVKERKIEEPYTLKNEFYVLSLPITHIYLLV